MKKFFKKIKVFLRKCKCKCKCLFICCKSKMECEIKRNNSLNNISSNNIKVNRPLDKFSIINRSNI